MLDKIKVHYVIYIYILINSKNPQKFDTNAHCEQISTQLEKFYTYDQYITKGE